MFDTQNLLLLNYITVYLNLQNNRQDKYAIDPMCNNLNLIKIEDFLHPLDILLISWFENLKIVFSNLLK